MSGPEYQKSPYQGERISTHALDALWVDPVEISPTGSQQVMMKTAKWEERLAILLDFRGILAIVTVKWSTIQGLGMDKYYIKVRF